MTPLTTVLIFYFAVINLITIIATCLDKYFAKKDMMRISEKTLITFALLGGSLAEYITMRIICHKTLHNKFMIGLPLIMIMQIALVLAALYLSRQGII